MKDITLKIFTVVMLIMGVTAVAHSAGRFTVGLVLSGGGAKGVAHAGVIRALEENDIPVDYVAGTSMGAIVGSLYSCGWSPEEMIRFFTSKDFGYWSTGTINPDNTYYFSRQRLTPKWASVNLNFKDTTSSLVNQVIPESLISPLPMNIEFLKLYSPYSKQCDENFDRLFVPFRCVTSDVYRKHKIVMREGHLGDAVRASMSFPLVFRPIRVNGTLCFDGGIYDNFPVDVMEEDFNPDFIIGVSVSGPDGPPEEGNVYSQLEDMIIQNNNYNVPADKGIKIQVPVLQYGVLDFPQSQTIYDIGYRTGLAMVDSIKRRISERRPLEEVTRRREAYASKTPRVEFDSVKVTGANEGQSDYLRYLFQGRRKEPFTMERTENAYYRAVTDGTLSNLVPNFRFNADGSNTLLLKASVKKPWSVGVGGWITSSANSMLYIDFGYHTLSFNSLDVSLGGWIGQSYLAGMLTGRFTLRSDFPSCVELQAVMSRQKYYDTELLFYQTSTPTFITEIENYVRANYIWAMGKRVEGYVGMGGGYLSDSYYPTNDEDYSEQGKDKTQYKAASVYGGFRESTLNDAMYPSRGLEWQADVSGNYERSRFIDAHRPDFPTNYKGSFHAILNLKWKEYFELHRHFSVGFATDILATAGPVTQNYTATLIHAPAFAPTPSTRNYFNEAFRSNNYVAGGVIPVWSPVKNLQLRGDFYVYSPIRNLERVSATDAAYRGWFRKADFIGEVAAVYNFPFASLSIYGNYLSYPARNWNFGINFGLLFQAPKLLK